jgi:hypothetical protein
MDRYLIIVLPPFLLLVAWGFERLAKRQRWIQPVFITIALLLNGVSIWQLSHNPAHFRSDWRTALQLVQEEPTDAIVVIGQQDIILPLVYYGSDRITYIQIPPPDGEAMSAAYIASMNQQMATAVQKSAHVWLIEAFYNHDTHQFPDKRSQLVADETQSMAQTWLKANFATLARHNLPGLRLTLYDLETAVHDN